MVELQPVDGRIDMACRDCGAVRGLEGRIHSPEFAAIIRAFVEAHRHGTQAAGPTK
jgi:hypothetical protein